MKKPGAEYPDEIHDLEWITRMSGLPFRVRDVLQEIINNDDLPEGCEVRIFEIITWYVNQVELGFKNMWSDMYP